MTTEECECKERIATGINSLVTLNILEIYL